MKSESPNVRSLVKALVPLVKKCPSMTANDVRSAMYGLQGMHSSSKEGNRKLIYPIFFPSDLIVMSYGVMLLTLLLFFASICLKIHIICSNCLNYFSNCKNESSSAFFSLCNAINDTLFLITLIIEYLAPSTQSSYTHLQIQITSTLP